VLETWTIVAGAIAAAPVLMTGIREELLDRGILKSRIRARAILGIGRPRMEAAPRAGTLGPPVGQGENRNMDTLSHCPSQVYYEELATIDGIVHIRVPEDKPKKARKPGLSRRDRALLAADVLQRAVDFRSWPVSRVAEAFGASTRSTFEALTFSVAERDDIRNGKRPLFPRRSSIPEPTPTPAQYLERAVNAFGLDRTLTLLAKAEAEAMATADVTDTIDEAA
jgi:hypothetical protein